MPPSIPGLVSVIPHPEFKEKLMLFGQFVGDWDIKEARYPQLDGTVTKRHGEIHFGWILDGRGIQDVWMIRKEGRAIPVGTTIRFYDPKIDAWYSTWISPMHGLVQTFVARKVGDEIVLEGKSNDGYPEHWIFSEITPDAFHWRAVESHDNEKSWKLTEEMRVTRREAKRHARA